MSTCGGPPKFSEIDGAGLKSILPPKGPCVFRQRKVIIDFEAADSCLVQHKDKDEIASQSCENGSDWSDTSDIDADHPLCMSDSDEFEKIRWTVSYFPRLLELPARLHGLIIEHCVGLRSLPKEVTHGKRYLRDLFILNCCNLESFHRGHLPIGLELLFVENCRKLKFLPSTRKVPKNSVLEYLRLQSSCDSLSFLPLDPFPKLGTLIIVDCANFSSILITKDHMSLNELKIQHCPRLLSFPEGGLCTPNLSEISLTNCKNLKALPDQLYKLTSLMVLDINGCPELESIPEGGFPCNLYSLCITSCDKLTPRVEWGMFKLEKLRYFGLEGGCKGLTSFPDQNLLPSSVTELWISKLQNLQYLDYEGLKHLALLRTLRISSCKWLRSLPRGDHMLASLTSLYINECPLLKSNFQIDVKMKKMSFGIDHIRHVQIDDEII